MKVKFSFLYKNGKEDVVDQEGTEGEIASVVNAVEQGFREDFAGVITVGNGTVSGKFIRLSDITRLDMKLIEE